MEGALKDLLARLEKVTARLEVVEGQLAKGGAPAPVAAAPAGSSVAKEEFEALIAKHLDPIVSMSEKISPLLCTQIKEFIAACKEEARIVGIAAQSQKPSQNDFQTLLKPLGEMLNKIAEYKGKHGRVPEFNCIAGVSEAIPCLNWIMVEPAPVPFIKEMIPGSEFYTNRVLVAYKGKDQNYIDWVKGFNTFLKDLADYIKARHTTGLAWNPKGGNALSASSSSSSTTATSPTPGGPPPPPPPPPPAIIDVKPVASGGGAMGAVFADLNKGETVTSKLSHVTNEMKTKNRSEEEKAKKFEPTTTTAKKAPAATPKATTSKPKGPPVFELKGNKWVVENQEGATLKIEDAQMNHTVYFFNNKGTTLVITAPKINCVTVDSCDKCAVVMESVVASLELVNANNTQAQVNVKTPAINVDKCQGIELWLSKTASEEPLTEIYTAKCSSINVLIPGATADADRIEMPIPEQFKSLIRGNKLTTNCSSHV